MRVPPRLITGAAISNSDDVSLQRVETVERHSRVGRGVGTGAFDQDLVADGERHRQRIEVLLVEHVGRIAGRTGNDAGLHLVAVAHRADRVADRLVHGFGETAELADVEEDPASGVVVRFLGNQDDFGLDHAGIADHAAARLDDRVRDLVAEMGAQRRKDRLTIGFGRGNITQILGWETAAHVDHLQVDALFGERNEDALGIGKRIVPGVDLGHLRADVKRHAVGFQTQLMGVDEHVDSHLRNAAELARQRPFGAFAIRQHAAEHTSAGSGTGNLLDFLVAVDGEEADTECMRTGDIALLLDRVAEGDAGSGRPGIERHFDFSDGRAIEIGAEAGEQAQHFRSGVGLDGIVDGAVRHGMTEGVEVVADDIEIDHQARTVRTSGSEKVANTLRGHVNSLSIPKAPGKPQRTKGDAHSLRNQPVETPVPCKCAKRG
ncbi:hypothetical protein RHSP_28371 [Rhizobium freirei PRF 81]|uniref:Uncharacterized protein n=1 Tax=Rhizobium freirei PRF 81 TaxID=363754 RepID=N6UBA5_9HYPH|nr:hypothetical protein RHSP_28371 [Rhizobium freirei PRF 81]